MPWKVQKDERCPADKPWGVVKSDDNELEGCHMTEEQAKQQQAALYANERAEEPELPAHPPKRGTAPRENLVRGVFPIALRAAGEDGAEEDPDKPLHLTGHFTRFDEWARIDSVFEGTFLERMKRGAFRKTIKENRDRIQVLFQHGMDPQLGDKPIADIETLREEDDGPFYDAELLRGLPPLVLDGLERGKYGASFRFSVIKDAWAYPEEPTDYNPSMLPERTVHEARVFEFGPVTFPAYDGATAGVRSLTDAYTLNTAIRDPERLTAALADLRRAHALTPEPVHTTPPAGSRTVAPVTVTPTPPTAAPATRQETPMEEKRMTIEEREDRQTEITSRLQAINKEHEGVTLPAEAQTEWDELTAEAVRHTEAIEHLRRRQHDLEVQAVMDRSKGLDGEGETGVRSARFGVPTPVDPQRILSPVEIRGAARSSDDEVRMLRDNAHKAIAVGRFSGAPDRAAAQERAAWLLENVREDKDTRGRLARRILDTSTPLYDRAFAKYVSGRPTDNDEARALSLTAGEGGYAVPFDLDPTIMGTGALGQHPFRRIARVIPISGDVWKGITSGGITAAYAAEATETTDNAPTLAQPEISTEKAQAFIPFSIEIGMDWGGMRGEMTRELNEAKETLEATKFVAGTGTNEPAGVIVGATTTVNATTGQTFDAGDIYALSAALPTRYQANASVVANRAIFDLVRQFTLTGQSNPWKDLEEPTADPTGRVGSLLGYPAYFSSAMAAVTTTGSKFMILGDFSRFVIVERIGLEVELIPHLFGSNQRPTGQRGLYAFWRNGSEVINADAFRVLIGIA